MKSNHLRIKTSGLIVAITIIALLGIRIGLGLDQIITLLAFSLSILGTLLFWEFRLSFAFLGSAIILLTRVVSLNTFLRLASMEIIFFLIGMMIMVGFLREIGLFTWLLQRAITIRNISAKRFLVALIFSSALLACVLDEVSSILLMIMIILELSDYFEINPIPFIVASVLATNIGSAGTVMGNPIGLLIATKASLTFEDFIRYSFPLMMVTLFLLTGMLFILFRKQLIELDEKIRTLGANDFLVKLLSVPPEKKLRVGGIIFATTILLIAFHHRLEILLNLETNTILLIAPMLTASIVMIWRRHSARSYIERDVEWWTLLFFIFLFAQAGVVAQTGVAETLAKKLLLLVADSRPLLIATILFGGAFISSALDNVVVVAGFIPILHSLNTMLHTDKILWWTLLFGACFGGNITVIGSTANIMAIGALERLNRGSIGFLYWLRIGIVVGLVTLAFIFLCLLTLPWYH